MCLRFCICDCACVDCWMLIGSVIVLIVHFVIVVLCFISWWLFIVALSWFVLLVSWLCLLVFVCGLRVCYYCYCCFGFAGSFRTKWILWCVWFNLVVWVWLLLCWCFEFSVVCLSFVWCCDVWIVWLRCIGFAGFDFVTLLFRVGFALIVIFLWSVLLFGVFWVWFVCWWVVC